MPRGLTAFCICLLFVGPASAGTWRFDFSPAKAVTGHILVMPDTIFAADRGYGFEPAALPRGPIGSAIPSEFPVAFSVAVPEGDYHVTVVMGAEATSSDTTVMAESRRLMLDHVTTKPGEFVTRSFVVNVRNAAMQPLPPTAPGGSQIRLSPRELISYTWDDRLTLAFSGRAPKIVSVEIEPVTVTRLFLLGDSTVTDQPDAPWTSWGQMLPRFLGPGIAVANHAQSGETLKSFLTGLRFDKVLSQLRAGDWVFIQFGHNDEKSQWPQTYAPAETTYRAYLRAYIAEIRRLGAHPVLVTSPERRNFDSQGHIVRSHGTYPQAVRAVAKEEGVPVVDLNGMSIALYEALGPARTPLAFVPGDMTHHSAYGAYEMARCVVRAIQDSSLPLAKDVLPGQARFDPANPDRPEDFGL